MLITFPLRVMLIDSNRPLPSSSSRPLAPFSTMTTKIMVAAGSVASRRGHATPLIDRPSPLPFHYFDDPLDIIIPRVVPINADWHYRICVYRVYRRRRRGGRGRALIVISNDSRGNDDGIAFAERTSALLLFSRPIFSLPPIHSVAYTLVGWFFPRFPRLTLSPSMIAASMLVIPSVVRVFRHSERRREPTPGYDFELWRICSSDDIDLLRIFNETKINVVHVE